MPKVTFEREEIVVDAPQGSTVLEIAEKAGVEVFRGMWPGLHCKRITGWCNRCKLWVRPDAPNGVNPPTGKEKMPRLNGRVGGTLRLACQVQVLGDVTVHTRAGGPDTKPGLGWEATQEDSAWKQRWAKRHDAKGQPEEEEAADAES